MSPAVPTSRAHERGGDWGTRVARERGGETVARAIVAACTVEGVRQPVARAPSKGRLCAYKALSSLPSASKRTVGAPLRLQRSKADRNPLNQGEFGVSESQRSTPTDDPGKRPRRAAPRVIPNSAHTRHAVLVPRPERPTELPSTGGPAPDHSGLLSLQAGPGPQSSAGLSSVRRLGERVAWRRITARTLPGYGQLLPDCDQPVLDHEASGRERSRRCIACARRPIAELEDGDDAVELGLELNDEAGARKR